MLPLQNAPVNLKRLSEDNFANIGLPAVYVKPGLGESQRTPQQCAATGWRLWATVGNVQKLSHKRTHPKIPIHARTSTARPVSS
jgi:hypothetical protein